MPATVHLLHGMPGCGKTHFAAKLTVSRRCVLLSHDEWVVGLLGSRPTTEQLEAVRPSIQELIWKHAERVIHCGVDVVLDSGFWRRRDRNEARARVQRIGATHILYSFDCQASLAWKRVKERNLSKSNHSLYIDEQAFWHFVSCIDPLMPDESAVQIRSDALLIGETDTPRQASQGPLAPAVALSPPGPGWPAAPCLLPPR